MVVDVNSKHINRRILLVSAIRSRDGLHLQTILDLNPDIHQRCRKDRTPLMHAVEVEFDITVRRLIDKGAEVNGTTHSKSTALHQAASKGSTNMIELPISLNASLEC